MPSFLILAFVANLATILLVAGVLCHAGARLRAGDPLRPILARGVAFLLVCGTVNTAMLLA
jgi:hypothetical protein